MDKDLITEPMVSAALAVLRASGRFPLEAEGADQELVRAMLRAASDALPVSASQSLVANSRVLQIA